MRVVCAIEISEIKDFKVYLSIYDTVNKQTFGLYSGNSEALYNFFGGKFQICAVEHRHVFETKLENDS